MRDRRMGLLWKAMGVFLFFTLTQNAATLIAALAAAKKLSIAGGLFAAMESDAVMAQVNAWSPLILLIADGAVIMTLLLWGALKEHRPPLDYAALRNPIGPAVGVLCVLAGAAANFWFALAINLLPWPQGWITEYAGNASVLSGTDPVTLLAVILFAPACEELVFRGRIYGYLSEIIPAGAAVILQAVLFGGLHAGKVWMLYAFCVGCVLGYVRKLTGSLRGSLYMHISFNATANLFDLFARRLGDHTTAVMAALLISAGLFLACVYEIGRHSRKEGIR
ncbi:MAG: type II CAAX endopeptidase family protein [Clostridiaceae bacterium]|nr:type II CAAX endopeptidase family protein [Clostridiaceae bacterium]